jgi:N-acetylmuramoyl-L-alanine amidase
MQELAIGILKSIVVLGLMLGYYRMALRDRKMHHFNRFYLLLTTAVSIVVPMLHLQWKTTAAVTTNAAIKMLTVVNAGGDELPETTNAASGVSVAAVCYGIYGLVFVCLLVLTLLKMRWIGQLRRNGEKIQMDGYTIVYTQDARAPFSFFSTLYWNRNTDMNSAAGKLILQHELTHIHQRHTIDKLLLQLVVIACWINPVYRLVQRELSMVHEFLADATAIEDNDTAAFATMLLGAHYSSVLPVMINPFYSSIKRRLMMQEQNKTIRYEFVRKAMVLPLVAITVLLFSFTVHSGDSPVVRSRQRMVLVLDAAHGGIDAGGQVAGLKEKELTRKICDRISVLADEYNVDIVQTRMGDEYVSLKERANIANKQDNAVLLAVHVNKGHAAVTDKNGVHVLANEAKNGIEIILSARNVQSAACSTLASAVVGQLQQAKLPTTISQKGIMVLNDSRNAAIAIEFGNMDNANDMAILLADNRLEALCRNVLTGIVAYSNSRN